jgi:hypothetical protein
MRQMGLCTTMIRYGLILWSFVFLTGCTFLTEDISTPLDPDRTGLNGAETHFSTVLKILGLPTTVSANDNGMCFLYEYIIDLFTFESGPAHIGNAVNDESLTTKERCPWIYM